ARPDGCPRRARPACPAAAMGALRAARARRAARLIPGTRIGYRWRQTRGAIRRDHGHRGQRRPPIPPAAHPCPRTGAAQRPPPVRLPVLTLPEPPRHLPTADRADAPASLWGRLAG